MTLANKFPMSSLMTKTINFRLHKRSSSNHMKRLKKLISPSKNSSNSSTQKVNFLCTWIRLNRERRSFLMGTRLLRKIIKSFWLHIIVASTRECLSTLWQWWKWLRSEHGLVRGQRRLCLRLNRNSKRLNKDFHQWKYTPF